MPPKKLIEIELPGTSFNERLEWANNKFVDLCEGIIDVTEAQYVWNVIIGWTDIGATEDQKRQYVQIANAISEVVRGNNE